MSARGKDKVWLLGAAHEHFDMARQARQQKEWRAVEWALCLSLSYHLIANSQQDACTALGNLAMTYEQIGSYAIALRLQQYALAMKGQFRTRAGEDCKIALVDRPGSGWSWRF